MKKARVAIVGSGNIGTDLMVKILRRHGVLEMAAMVGIDASSDGLARAARMGVATTHEGVSGLMNMPEFSGIEVVFDATSAAAHLANYALLKPTGVRVVDLTPAAIGPYVVPAVNLSSLSNEQNLNLVTCGGQATIPMVAAVSRVAAVHYGEIVASIASKSAGPGTRANIDEFTETTALGIERVGGARRGKAIIVLNPAEPPLVMRDTVFTISERANRDEVRQSIEHMVAEVQRYVPGYSLHQEVQFDDIPASSPVFIEGIGAVSGLKTTVFLKVVGAGHYLPPYAGNLDIMTSAALAVGEKLVESSQR